MSARKAANYIHWYIIAALWFTLYLYSLGSRAATTEQIPYSRFEELLAAGKIKSVSVTKDVLYGELRAPEGRYTSFSTVRVEPELAKHLSERGASYGGALGSSFAIDFLSWVLPTLLLIAFWSFLLRRSARGPGGGFMSIGKSHAKVYLEKDVQVTFKDVAGIEEAAEDLKEIINFLKNPSEYHRLGGRLPKGILLVGPPGTGKTLLARAVAGEAGVPFFSISGSEFVELFVGIGAARVRDLFVQARAHSPCIVFIDELDALGRARGSGVLGGANDEKEQTLNQLLAELDGFDPSSGVVLLAATNRPEILDPALLRSGRFDRQIVIDLPDKRGRLQILTIHVRPLKIGPDVRIEEIAALTPGFSGADLANVANEAALLATRRHAEFVSHRDFLEAMERLVAGLERKAAVLSTAERRTSAYHELGHALCAWFTPGSDPVMKVSIIPRGMGALGYTLQRPAEDKYILSRDELQNRILVLLGGRAAEQLFVGRVSTGAADDLYRATQIARDMVTRFGMEPRVGMVTFGRPPSPFLSRVPDGLIEQRLFSEETAREIDCAIKEIISEGFQGAMRILESRRDLMNRIVGLLLEKETLTHAQLEEAIFSGHEEAKAA